jgi:hypothetical protein
VVAGRDETNGAGDGGPAIAAVLQQPTLRSQRTEH